MRYKGDYSPSYLVDPEDYSWAPLDKCRPLLDKYHYACFTHPERSLEIPATSPGASDAVVARLLTHTLLVVFVDPTPSMPMELLRNAQHVVRIQRGQVVVAPIIVSPRCHAPVGGWHSSTYRRTQQNGNVTQHEKPS